MLALKSGSLAADAIAEAFQAQDFSAERFASYSQIMREGLENMRKLVYAFYDPGFSFRKLTDKYPDLVGDITDCLSGDVNKDFSRLYAGVAETAEVPAPLLYGAPLVEQTAAMPVLGLI
jgi:flavin-dependent dehydrogenase